MKTKNNETKSKLENYWYYYKIHTIVGIFMAIAMIYTLVQCVNNTEPDFCAVCAYTGYTDITPLEDKLAKSVGDVNGDGKLAVQCDNLFLSGNPNAEQDIATREKLVLTLTDGDYRLYIMEKEFFENEFIAECFENLNGILPSKALEGSIDYKGNKIAIPTTNCPYLIGSGLYNENVYVGIIAITPATENKKNIKEQYDISKRLICEMVN